MKIKKPRLGRVKVTGGVLDQSLPVRLQISIFNKKCTGDYFTEICMWLRDIGVRNIEIQISDSLQKYNFSWREELNEQEALTKAIATGDSWLKENSTSINYLLKFCEKLTITRWAYWVNHPKFEGAYTTIEKIFESDAGLKDEIDKEIEHYFQRSNRSKTPARIKMSQLFMLEELAVSSYSAENYPANELYPGSRFAPEVYLARHFGGETSIKKDHLLDLDVILLDGTQHQRHS